MLVEKTFSCLQPPVDTFHIRVECKSVEKLNVWGAYEQAAANSGKHEPLLVMKKNRKKPLVVLDAEAFMELVKKASMTKLHSPTIHKETTTETLRELASRLL